MIIEKIILGACDGRIPREVTGKGHRSDPSEVRLRLLVETKNHPTASEIYNELRKQYPTISQATVYSTLELLKKVGQIHELSIRGNKACFDPMGEPHYHLFCRRCRRVLDVRLSCPPLKGASLEGHRVEAVQFYLYGVCADCLRAEEDALADGLEEWQVQSP